MRNPVRVLVFAAVGLVVLLIVGRAAAIFYTDALWFASLGQSGVFWTRITTNIAVRVVTTTFAAVVVLLNLWFVLRQLGPVHLRRRYGNIEIAEQVPRKLLLLAAVGIAVLAGWWLSSLQFGGDTPVEVLAWLRHESWGVADPVFNRDVSFYLFTLPILARIVEYLLIVALWSAVLVTIGYVLVGAIRVRGTRWDIDERPRIHFALLIAAAFVLLGVRIFLSRYQLVLHGTGVGAALGFTDVHARLPARFAISVLLIAMGGALVYGVVRQLWAPPLITFGLLVLVALGMGVAYPQIVQKFTVEPNQLAREAEYIRWNLEFTRRAYGLDRIERQPLPYRRADGAVWSALSPTLQRLPLWDPAPLQTAFNEIETYRYYHFADVDLDRYGPPGAKQQVAIAVREFTPEGVDEGARTWQNMHMNPIYTRGIGAIVTPAAEKRGGDPIYWLSDIRPVKRDAAAPVELDLSEPSVYFGETMSEYAIVGYGGTFSREERVTGRQPADLPVVTTGIPLGSFVRVLAFASRFSEPNLLFTGNLSDSTRFIFRRGIVQRANTLAPFLVWDPDALPIVLDGRIVWVLDGYTASENYPLARATVIQGLGSVRYMRGSVKATVDAVTGEVRMYALPDGDPIVRTYRAIFPELIQDWSAMPAAIQEHLRYPPLLFEVQANMLDEFHIEEPQAFFSGQDMWQLPQDITPQERRRSQLGYTLASLPGSPEPEFLLMQPFIARERHNMTALLAARNDAPHYGELVLLTLPRDDQIKGPAQVQTIIEQDPFIAERLSLWRRLGSTVTMGQLRILPTDSSVVYVRPLFLSAEDRGIPQLQRVVVSDGTAVSMAEDLGAAIAGLGGQFAPAPRTTDDPPSTQRPATDEALRQRALDLMREADERLRAGDFAGFGAAWNQLRALMERGDAGGGR